MQCLYCGKDRPLFKRLTGGGEFCSEAHKKSYHEEYDRLALTRLLQAQAKPEKAESKIRPEPQAPQAPAPEERIPAMAGFLLRKPEVRVGADALTAPSLCESIPPPAVPRLPELDCISVPREPIVDAPTPPIADVLPLPIIPYVAEASAQAHGVPALPFASAPLYKDNLRLRLCVTGLEFSDVPQDSSYPEPVTETPTFSRTSKPQPSGGTALVETSVATAVLELEEEAILVETSPEKSPRAALQLAVMTVDPLPPAKPGAGSGLSALPSPVLRPRLPGANRLPLHPRIVAAAHVEKPARKTAPAAESEKAYTKAPSRRTPPVAETKPAAAVPATLPPPAQVQPAVPAPNFGPMPSQTGSLWAGMSSRLKLLAGTLILAVLVGVGYLTFGFGSHPSSGSVSAASGEAVGASIMMGEGGWSTDWAGDAAASHAGRQITIYRPSLQLSDYRLEFQAQIENRSVGWVFRAKDPSNYYAMKIEAVSSGRPSLVRYLVLNGKEQQRSQIPLSLGARADLVYSVRLDVRGARFSTMVQGQPVDVWTDERLKSGGVGFYNERGERAHVKSVQISMLGGGR
jgi:hypothetical protein